MYKTRIKSWGLDKNFKESEVVELFRLKRERDRMGKLATTYSIRGREVDWERVQSYVKRKGLNMAVLINTAPQSPSSGEVSCRTPCPEDAEQRTINMPPLSPASSTASTSQGIRTPVSALYRRPSPQHEMRGSGPPPSQTAAAYRPASAAGSSAFNSIQRPETIHRLQNLLSRIYETVLYEDGDKSWGTTEYWLRNARSQEWITTSRYKLALYKDFIQSEAARGAPEVVHFKAINRSFAMLEPLSGGIIGTRMFYLVSFFFAFAETSPFQNPFASTARQLLEEVEASLSAPPLGSITTSNRPGGLPDINTMDEDYEMGDSDSSPPTPRFVDGQATFQDSAARFLQSVLDHMVRMLGLTLPSESLLLLKATKDGYPLPPSYPPPQPSYRPHHHHHQHQHHLSPHPPTPSTKPDTTKPDLQASASLLDHAVYLLSQRKDNRAEETLLSLLSSVDKESQQPPTPTTSTNPKSIPSSPSSSSLFSSSASPSETGGGGSHSYSSREAKVLSRCAHYHLSSIYSRRGGEHCHARAREHTIRAVKGSLLYDSFVGWEEVEFLFV